MNNYKQEAIKELAKSIKSQGFRVFIAGKGDYGFFTDTAGSRVVCFACDLGNITYSGNYKTSAPSSTGTGWGIGENCKDFNAVFNSPAPGWALRGASYKYTTLEQHLKTYQASSKYEELEEIAA